nr:MAG TPA: hypothetical protein [Caudoviricetes sp.]
MVVRRLTNADCYDELNLLKGSGSNPLKNFRWWFGTSLFDVRR